jgi:hypothetical protein
LQRFFTFNSVMSLLRSLRMIRLSLTELFGFLSFYNFSLSWFMNLSWSRSFISSLALLMPSKASFKFLLSFGSYATSFYRVFTFFIGFFFFSSYFFFSSLALSFSYLPSTFSFMFSRLSTGKSFNTVPSSYKFIPGFCLKFGFFPSKFIS